MIVRYVATSISTSHKISKSLVIVVTEEIVLRRLKETAKWKIQKREYFK